MCWEPGHFPLSVFLRFPWRQRARRLETQLLTGLVELDVWVLAQGTPLLLASRRTRHRGAQCPGVAVSAEVCRVGTAWGLQQRAEAGAWSQGAHTCKSLASQLTSSCTHQAPRPSEVEACWMHGLWWKTLCFCEGCEAGDAQLHHHPRRPLHRASWGHSQNPPSWKQLPVSLWGP